MNKLNILKKQINYFKSKNIKIKFFLIPMHKKIINSTKIKDEIKILKETFPNIPWIPYPKSKKFYSNDSIHLIYPSAYNYTKYFLKNKDMNE